MLKPISLPRINEVLFFTILTCVILYFGKELFILVTFAALLSMLMAPLSNKLEKYRISRTISSIISVFIIIAVLVLVTFLLSEQITNVLDDIPAIKSGIQDLIRDIQAWINEKTGISFEKQISTVKEQASGAVNTAAGFLTDIVRGTFKFLASLLLLMVFTFLFLLHREKYENFVVMLYNQEKRNEARQVMAKVNKVAQQYFGGRLVTILFLGLLFLIGFSVIGLKNAALLAVITAVFTFIPYVGPLIGGVVPLIMAVIIGSSDQAVWVMVIILISQLIDHYFIEPYFVGGSINISPFFTIFILLLGGALWGIAGVILFLPLLGILKIIFESVDGLEPYAYLIGDQKEFSSQNKIWSKVKSWFSRKK